MTRKGEESPRTRWLRELWRHGLPDDVVAQLLGWSRKQVRAARARIRRKDRQRRDRGEK